MDQHFNGYIHKMAVSFEKRENGLETAGETSRKQFVP